MIAKEVCEMRKGNRRYTSEFKLEAVRMALGRNGSVGQVARGLGVPANNLYKWIRLFEEDSNGNSAKVSARAESPEMRELRRELERVRMERDILKKAIAVFSQQPR
jgi:transposase